MRAAIYARYSSDLQSESSIDDQVRLCREFAEREGWELVEIYSDAAVSGATTLRPGYQSLLENAREGEFDVVVAEALDRLSRDQEDIAGLYKQLCFAGIDLLTLAEGKVNELHIGLKGTMNALYLKDLAQKTRRGLEGRVRQGRSGGGLCYGYDVVKETDGNGDPVAGGRAINLEEAEVVRRIFQDYLAGKSPRAIAIALNRERVTGPRHNGWTASTIIGSRKRGNGILNNALYTGQLVWNRQRFIKDPVTGKRQARSNPKATWVTKEVSHLRIIEDDLWNETQTRQEQRSLGTRPAKNICPDWQQRRPKHLFSGLIKCASCGGGMTLVSRVYYGCSASRNKGTCDNRLTIRLDRLEKAVLRGLQEHLLTPELTETFIREYTREINRLRAEVTTAHAGLQQRLAALDKQIANIVEAITEGRTSGALLDRLETLEREKHKLQIEMSKPTPTSIRIHPNVAEHYVAMIGNLRDWLNRTETKAEAATILRTLVEKIRLHPINGELQIELCGDLMLLFNFAGMRNAQRKKPGSGLEPGCTTLLVAGAGLVQAPTITRHV